jgi:hypothetical protein
MALAAQPIIYVIEVVWLYRSPIPCALGGHYMPSRRLEERERESQHLVALVLEVAHRLWE